MNNEIKKTAQEKMDKAILNLKSELNSVRAGRANPKMLDKIIVDYYGSPTPINQLGSVSAPEPRMLVIHPWDVNAISDIEKAILKSDLGLNPNNDGKLIRLVIPQLTEERRKQLVKVVKKQGEESKVAIRNIRRHAIHELKEAEKESMITEDDLKHSENEIQKITDSESKKVDEMVKIKISEVLEV